VNIKKIAIAADNPEVYSQTFILRHINELGDGNTAIILTKRKLLVKTNKPVFIFERSSHISLKVLRFFLNLGKLKFRSERKRKSEELKFFIDKYQIGYVLAEFGYIGVIIYDAVIKNKIPMFCYFRGSDASRKLSNQTYVSKLKNMMPQINGIFAVSQSLIDNLKNVGVEHPNTHIIPSGVDTRLFSPGTKDVNLLVTVGRFTEKKAPHITIQAFATVLKTFPNARLEMVGDGELLKNCMELAKTLGITKNVIFHGAMSHLFIRDLLAKASLFIQHSITASNGDTEGMPTAIQEAMSSGCVIVSTKHAGIPEHIENGTNGLLVEEGNINAFTNSIIDMLSNKKLSEGLAKSAREYAIEHLDYKVNYKKLEKIIYNS
jgi:glycosyltransferase involved in cell wall biosynthesis